MENSLFSIRANEDLEFFELNLEDEEERFLSYAAGSYIGIDSDGGEIEWHTQVPSIQIYLENNDEWKIRGPELVANQILIGDSLLFINLKGDLHQTQIQIKVKVTGVDITQDKTTDIT